MDEKKFTSPQLPVDKMSHTPEVGFTDIKPLQLDLSNTSQYIQNILILMGVALLLYIIYLQFNKRSKKQKKLKLNFKDQFKESLDQLKTKDLTFREHCEYLTFTFKNLISSILVTKLEHLTPRPFCEKFLNESKRRLSETSETILNEMVEGSYKLLVKLENGEYGDEFLHRSIKDQKNLLADRVLELGNEIIKIFNQRAKEKSK